MQVYITGLVDMTVVQKMVKLSICYMYGICIHVHCNFAGERI